MIRKTTFQHESKHVDSTLKFNITHNMYNLLRLFEDLMIIIMVDN